MTCCLFVGGTRDGEWIDVPNNVDAWVVAHPTSLIGEYGAHPAAPAVIHQERYLRQRWESAGILRSVFYAEAMTANAVLDQLLLGYLPRRLHK